MIKTEINSFYAWKWEHFCFFLVFIDGFWFNVQIFAAMVIFSTSHSSDPCSYTLYFKSWLISGGFVCFVFNAALCLASLVLCLRRSWGDSLHCGPVPMLAIVLSPAHIPVSFFPVFFFQLQWIFTSALSTIVCFTILFCLFPHSLNFLFPQRR